MRYTFTTTSKDVVILCLLQKTNLTSHKHPYAQQDQTNQTL
jgi:hypothetical protein